MKKTLTEEQLRQKIYEMVKKQLDEADEPNISSTFILQPKYTDFIKNACHILAWKGLNFDLNIRGMAFRVAQKMVGLYRNEKQEAIKSSRTQEEAKAAVAGVKEKWRHKNGCEGLVESEKAANDLFVEFKQSGYEFISKFLGGKSSPAKQMEKEAGLALFGDEMGLGETTLNEFHIMNGAVFCVRDFFRWVEAGKPEFQRTKAGKIKRGDVLKNITKTGIVSKDEIEGSEKGEEENEGTDLWRKVKELLDSYRIDSVGMAKALVGGSIREHQEEFQMIMLKIGEYRNFSKGTQQHDDAFMSSAYDVLNDLVNQIKEMHAEPIVDELLKELHPSAESEEEPAETQAEAPAEELAEGRLPADDQEGDKKAELIENMRKIKILAAHNYDLSDKLNKPELKELFGKILMLMIKVPIDKKADGPLG